MEFPTSNFQLGKDSFKNDKLESFESWKGRSDIAKHKGIKFELKLETTQIQFSNFAIFQTTISNCMKLFFENSKLIESDL